MKYFLLFLLGEIILSHFTYCDHQKSCELVHEKYEICKKYGILTSVKEDDNYYYKLRRTTRETLLYLSDREIELIAGNCFHNLVIDTLIINFAPKKLKLVEDSLNGLTELTHLYFHSGISSLKSNTFRPLRKLNTLALIIDGNNNQIIKDSLHHLQSLENLIISDSNLGQITAKTFNNNNCPHLYNLELIRNKIDSIEPEAFSSFANLESLKMMDNNLTRLRSIIFIGLEKLKRLIIIGGNLAHLEPACFADLKTENISIHNTKITGLKIGIFAGVKNLHNLDLHSNLIGVIGATVFMNLKNLTNLDLSDNKIDNIEPQSFSGLNNLRILNLRSNSIKYIPRYTFEDLKKLTNLDFSYNKINKIDAKSFAKLNLISLNLNNNELTVIESFVFQNLTVKQLDLTNNNISSIQKNAFIDSNLDTTYSTIISITP